MAGLAPKGSREIPRRDALLIALLLLGVVCVVLVWFGLRDMLG